MTRATLFTILIITLPCAFAQPPELEGKNQLSLHGGLDYQGPSGDNINIQAGYGWFLSDDILLGGEIQWSLVEDIAPGDNDYRSQQYSLFVEKLFIGDGNLVPYVGAEMGFLNTKYNDSSEVNEVDDSALVYGARGGVKFFLTESVSIDGSLVWLMSSDEIFIVDAEMDDQYLYPSIGINAIF